MSEEINHHRRRFLGTAVMTIAAAEFVMIGARTHNPDGWWYQYYFATERGRAGYDAYRRDFAKLIWKFNSPKWDFDDATFDRTAASFDNPDYVSIVIHNYQLPLAAEPG
jgi:hypothetical protein